MPPRAIKLGKPEELPSGKIRWQFQYKGHKRKSKTYDQDSRRTRECVRQEKREWIEEIDRLEQENQRSADPYHDARTMIAAPIRALIEHAQIANDPQSASRWQEILPMLTEADPSQLVQLLAIMQGMTPRTDDGNLEKLAGTFQPARLIIEDRKQTVKRIEASTDHELKAQAQADDFIALYQSKATSRQISVGRYGKVRAGINRFMEWFGPNKSLANINEQTVIAYYHHLTKAIEEGGNQNTISDDHSIFKLFVETVADTIPDVLRPSNLRSERYYIPRVSTEPNPFTVEECKLFLGKGVDHPAKYPQALCEALIKTFCPEGGTVLDCFAGSGTTLLGAGATGRNFYGIDVMKKYVDLARRRLEDGSQAA